MTRTTNIITILSTLLFVLSCQDDLENDLMEIPAPDPVFVDISQYYSQSANARTKASNYSLYMAEYLTTGEDSKMGNTVFFKNIGNKQLSGDFVPALALDGTTDISYYIDENRPSADLAVAESTGAINNAMDTWDGVACAEIGLTSIPFDGRTTGFVAAFFGFGGSFDYVADVIHNGWLPAAFFDLLAPGGSGFILGVTFTIIFTDANGDPVDTDNNGKVDVAWREIYYNDAFFWNIGSTFDVETVALHEAGHGLSQAHFGKAFLSNSNGKLHFSPRAVMNAAYSGVQTDITQSDNAGHCSNWAQWPEN